MNVQKQLRCYIHNLAQQKLFSLAHRNLKVCFRSAFLVHLKHRLWELLLWEFYKAYMSSYDKWNMGSLNPFTAKFSRKQISTKFPNVILWNFKKQIAPRVSTDGELSSEWSHHRILSAESKVIVTLQNSVKYYGSERVTEVRNLCHWVACWGDIFLWYSLTRDCLMFWSQNRES